MLGEEEVWGSMAEDGHYTLYTPIEADLDAWEAYVEEGIQVLAGCEPEEECSCPDPCWCIHDRFANLSTDWEEADTSSEWDTGEEDW